MKDLGFIHDRIYDALLPVPSQGLGYRFPAEITLNTQFIELKSGQKLSLQAGMSLTANIKLRKVSYLKLLLNKFVSSGYAGILSRIFIFE